MVKRGQIWWVELAEPKGSEPGYKRPVLIVQSDTFNRSRINTVMVAVLTSNLRLAMAPGNVKLAIEKTGLDRESVVNVSQIITIDKQFLEEKIGQVDGGTMDKIDEGIKLVLAL
jgi:mRNA interferase MazF